MVLSLHRVVLIGVVVGVSVWRTEVLQVPTVENRSQYGSAVFVETLASQYGGVALGLAGAQNQNHSVGMAAEHASIREIQHRRSVDQHQVKLLRHALQELGQPRRVEQTRKSVGRRSAGHETEAWNFGLSH